MHEVPDYEEIYGSDPNDARHFESRGVPFIHPVVTGGKANRWMVVGRLAEKGGFTLVLKAAEEGFYWFRPSSADCEYRQFATVFTDHSEADKVCFAAKEIFPDVTVWVQPFRVEE